MKTKFYNRENGVIEISIDTYTQNGDIIGLIEISCDACKNQRAFSGEHKRHDTLYCSCGEKFSY